MALSALDFPTDIRWERVCVTPDMVDPSGRDGQAPPRWQSSIAVFRYVPEDEYQLYPERRIVYFKVTCTISSYQPHADEVVGAVARADALTVGEALELDRKLKSYAPCNGAILQVTVAPTEDGVALDEYPYFADVQPKQRALYEQATDSNEVASRSVEDLNVTKGGGTGRSQEVLDIDRGSSASVQTEASGSYAGIGAGVGLGGSYSRSGEWGTKTLGQQNRSRVETTDSVREARETSSHTTQLTQMYTLLQAYHVGTNRVMFYVSPRPHVLEEPTGFIRGPRQIDGVQDFFLVVNQAEDQDLPCLAVRLDTGHLTVKDELDYDRSQPPTELSVNVLAPPPGELDPNKTAAGEGGDPGFSANYDCFELAAEPDQVSATAPAGYVVETVTDIGPIEVNLGSTELVVDPPTPAAGRSVTLRGQASGRACYRNTAGDALNASTLINLASSVGGPLGTLIGIGVAVGGSDAPGLEEVKGVVVGYARRTVRVHWRSEAPTKKTGERRILLVTTRVLCCCDEPSTPAKLVSIIPLDVELELAEASPPGPPGMTARAANALAARALEETARVASTIDNPAEAVALDAELALARVAEVALSTPRLRRAAARTADTIDGLGAALEERLVERALPGSPAGRLPSRLAVASTPTSTLAESLEMEESDALRLRLAALGLGRSPRTARTARRQRRG